MPQGSGTVEVKMKSIRQAPIGLEQNVKEKRANKTKKALQQDLIQLSRRLLIQTVRIKLLKYVRIFGTVTVIMTLILRTDFRLSFS